MTADERALSAAEVAREDSLKGALTAHESELGAYRAAAATDTTGEAADLAEESRLALLEVEAAWSAFRREIASKYPVREGQAFPLSRVQKALPEGHWLIADTMSRLGGAIAGEGKFAEAEPLLLEGHAGMKESRQVPTDRKRQAIQRIIQFYESWHRPDQTSEWRQRLEEATENGVDKD